MIPYYGYSILLVLFSQCVLRNNKYTEKTNNSFDKSVSSISVLREENPQKTQSSGSLLKRKSEGNLDLRSTTYFLV
jgi:hypothetical protein